MASPLLFTRTRTCSLSSLSLIKKHAVARYHDKFASIAKHPYSRAHVLTLRSHLHTPTFPTDFVANGRACPAAAAPCTSATGTATAAGARRASSAPASTAGRATATWPRARSGRPGSTRRGPRTGEGPEKQDKIETQKSVREKRKKELRFEKNLVSSQIAQ